MLGELPLFGRLRCWGHQGDQKGPNSSFQGTHRLAREQRVRTRQVTKSLMTKGEAIWKNQCQGTEMQVNRRVTSKAQQPWAQWLPAWLCRAVAPVHICVLSAVRPQAAAEGLGPGVLSCLLIVNCDRCTGCHSHQKEEQADSLTWHLFFLSHSIPPLRRSFLSLPLGGRAIR